MINWLMTLSFSLSLFVADGGRTRRFLRRHRRHFRNKIDSRLLRHERLTSRLVNRSRLVIRYSIQAVFGKS